MRAVFYTFVLGMFTILSVYAQRECDAEERHLQLLSEDASYRSAWSETPSDLPDADSGQTFTIPLVVHVIHLGEPVGWGSNISNGQIFQAIGRLNRDYQYANGYDTGLRFCLAKKDPDGRPTNGIVRVDGRGVPNYQALGLESSQGPGADETAVKDLSRWPNTEYYNIWVVHKIVGGVAGYAYYPTTYINDGTSIEALIMSPLFPTLSHELGHAFNLRHTFQGDGDGSFCPDNEDCRFQGDFCCDTPPHRRDDCFWSNPCVTGGSDFPNSANNFMSYCVQTDRFTADQRQRIREAALSYPRNLLAISDGCEELPARDGSITRITFPHTDTLNTYCQEIRGRFILANKGSAVIDRFDVTYQFDGPVRNASFTSDLAPGDSAEFELPAESLNTAIDFHQLQILLFGINNDVDENPANDTATVVFDIDACMPTGIADHLLYHLSIYPNPADGDLLHIRMESTPFGPVSLTIHDALGRIVAEEKLNGSRLDLDIQHLFPGTYFISLETRNGSRLTIPFVRF